MVSALRDERAGGGSRGKRGGLVSDQVESGKSVAACPLDVANPFHSNSQQYRFSDPNDPDGPSIHLSLPVGFESSLGTGYEVGFDHYPASPEGEFQVDSDGTTWGHIHDLWDLATQK
jgi:hypothetical protein